MTVTVLALIFTSLASAMSLETYRERIHNQLDWTSRALENRCRARVSLGAFTKTPLRIVKPSWRGEHVFYAKRKHERAQARTSLCVPWYVTKQITIAWKIANESAGDPWPNCPDPGPRDNQGPGHSWYDTVACENGGSWLDSPGYYRCGLQFDPGWERKYGLLCPL